tara:strand:+ start:294 stop:2144 length:1851 start_codon:yes stop_codon:yes gene_type:complete
MKNSKKQIIQMDRIMNEEIARACMILEAKKVFNEEGFQLFMNELKDYEANLVITESNQGEMLYEGLFDRLKNLAKGMANKIAPDNIKKIDQLAADLADADMELDTAKELGRTPNEIKALEAKRNVLLKQLAQIDPGYAQQAQQAADAENSADKNAAGGGEGGGNMNQQQKAAAVDDLFAKADAATTTARADSALGQIKNAFVGSFVKSSQANEEMWGAAKRFFSGLFQPKKPEQEDDVLMAILAKLQGLEGIGDKMPSKEKVKDEMEEFEDGEPEKDGDAGAEEEKKPITIRSIQRPIINVIQRVAAAQDVDVSVKDAQKIAIAITGNLADQMRANGVVFKGDKPKPKADAKPEEGEKKEKLKESAKMWDSVKIKNMFMEHLSYIISEERLAAKYGIKKEKQSPKEIGLDKRYKFGAVNPPDYIKAGKAIIKRFMDMGYNKKDVHYELKDTDNDDNFVDYYDMYLDIMDLYKFNRGTLRVATEEEEEPIKDMQKRISFMKKQYELHGGVKDDKTKKEMRKRWIQAKKNMKGMGKKEKAPEKDLSMADAKQGQVNLSKTLAKAVQAGGLDADVAKKITPILKKKIEKIIAKHMGADVKYLEEKINRYVLAVIKEVKA